jgi:putative aldouronate transport system substrate-binding protein
MSTLTLLSRRRFLMLAGSGLAAAALASCAPKQPATTTAPTAAPVESEATQAPDAEPTKAEAGQPSDAVVEVNYYFLAWGPMNDVELVQDAMSEITQDKIGCTVKLVPMDSSAFNERLKLDLAAGENIDLMYTCNWANDFYANVRNGVLVALDDLLPEYAPGLWASIKPEVWDAARVNGKLYGAINQQIWATINGFDIRKDVVEALSFDVSTLDGLDTYDPFFQAVKDNMDGMYPTGWFNPNESPTWWTGMWGLDGVGPMTYMRWDDEETKLAFPWEYPEFEQAIEIARRWYTSEFLPLEPTSGEDFVAQMKAGMYACVPINVAKPGRESEDKAKYGFDFLNIPIQAYSQPFVTTGSVVPTMNGLVRTCQNQEKAIRLLELWNTDVEAYNLICKGIEGKHWVWVDKERKIIGFPEGITPENSPYNPNTDWMFGNQFNAYYVDEAQAEANTWEKTRELNETSGTSKAMGFAFVQDPVANEVAQVTAADKEIGEPLRQGRLDPAENLPKYIEQMKAAGAEKVFAEVQKQFDEWKASR